MNENNSSKEEVREENDEEDKLPKVILNMNSKDIDNKLTDAKIDAEIRAYRNLVHM